MNPRKWARAGLMGFASLVYVSTCTPAQERQPNIVFIMADDLGYAHLGCYGGQRIRTPHIDRLASEGLRFTNVYAGCNVCAPCRSVLMQGLHGGHTTVRGNSGGIPLREEDVTVAEVLKQAGYACGGFGKWGLGDAGSSGSAWDQGFDVFFGYYDQVHAHSYFPAYLWKNDRKYWLPGNSGRAADGLTGDMRGQYSADVIMAQARQFIIEHADEPFFCYIPTTVPHTELLVPDDSLSEYAGQWDEPSPYRPEREHYRRQDQPRAAFAAMVTRLDREVGWIMELLDRLEIADETIVFFTSDNGGQGPGLPDSEFFEANKPLRGHKGSMYEGGLRVPMIVRWPGRITAGDNSDWPWYFADVLPTLADIAGVDAPPPTDGVSVLPTLLGQPDQQQREFLYWETAGYDARGAIRPVSLRQAVRMGDWKGIRQKAGEALELYDLSQDVSEAKDVASEHPEVVARISAIMDREHRDPPPQLEPSTDNGWAFR